MRHPTTIQLLVAGGLEAPGGADLLARASAAVDEGCALRVLLTGPGLAWIGECALARLGEANGVEVALCSRSAREAGQMLRAGNPVAHRPPSAPN